MSPLLAGLALAALTLVGPISASSPPQPPSPPKPLCPGTSAASSPEPVARSSGSAVGVAVFGAIANSIFGEAPVGVRSLVAGSGAVFFAVVVAGVVTLAAALAMPRTPIAGAEPSVGDPAQ